MQSGTRHMGVPVLRRLHFHGEDRLFPSPQKKKIQVNKNINDIAKGSTKILPHMKFLTSLSLFLIL